MVEQILASDIQTKYFKDINQSYLYVKGFIAGRYALETKGGVQVFSAYRTDEKSKSFAPHEFMDMVHWFARIEFPV